MTITPDKSALEKARERLEASMRLPTYPRATVDGMKVDASYVALADLRLVLDALAEAERDNRRLFARLAEEVKWGHMNCELDVCRSSGTDCPAQFVPHETAKDSQ